MKKILALSLAIVFVFGVMSFTAFAETPDRIEITFRVGDSILNINGEPVEVETPYVVDGVTLVPVRVITEAFGAEVEWVNETRQIVITYQNVELILQIDNINVYVNGQQQTLLFQPQLTNGVTMVPLRFISENFGAEVNWDFDTQEITVVKEAFGDALVDIEDVLRRSNMPMAGDSFLGWSIRRTPDMEVFFRSFDGRFNTFTISSNTFVEVDFFDNTENESFAAIQAQEMELARRFTLMGQNVRRTSGGAEFVSTQFRNDFAFVERRMFVLSNNQVVHVGITIDGSVGVSERDEYIAILDTFDFVFNAAETEDLADVVDNMRLFDNRTLGISFRVPAHWRDFSDRNRINWFRFGEIVDDGVYSTGGSIEVVTIQGDDSATRWATETLENSIRFRNPNTHTHSELRNMQVSGRSAVYYQIDRRLGGIDFISRRIFWDYEGHMYDLYITVPTTHVASIQRIVDSIKLEAIDPEVVGIMIREPITDENVVVSSVRNTSLGFTVDIPATWLRLDNNTMFVDTRTNTEVWVERLNHTFTLAEIRDGVTDRARQPEWTIVNQAVATAAAELSSNALRGFKYEMRLSVDGRTIYLIRYIINSGNRSYIITAAITESNYSEANRETIARIVRSFVVN